MPVITAATTATRDLDGGTGALRLVPPADPEALAVAIQEVCTSQAVRDALSEAGHRAFGKRLSRQAIAAQVRQAFM
jgi:glycosyltransferase involved in cell wall biosynthesis